MKEGSFVDKPALEKLATIVHNFCGINYFSNMSSFELKIKRRLHALKLDSVQQYIDHLNNHEMEWEALIQTVTINETYFFREDRQLQIYQQKILPSLISKGESIRVWSAACSTGEEPYTLAMLTLDANILGTKHIEITGTDINSHVLQVAKKGAYLKNSLSFRRIQPYWLKAYFDEDDTHFTLKNEVKRIVKFDYINLKSVELINQQQQYDVIFCRNVLIYFNEHTIEKIVQAFYRILKPGGYLFLGHAETITQFKNIGFETINEEGTFYYRKG